MNRKINSLIGEKLKDKELNRLLNLYKKLDDYIEAKPTPLDKLRASMSPPEAPVRVQIHYRRRDIPGRDIKITVSCMEILIALRDYCEHEIIKLTESDIPETKTEEKQLLNK
jgi:hypothetical protein